MRVVFDLQMWETFSPAGKWSGQGWPGGQGQERVWWETLLLSSWSGSQHRAEASLGSPYLQAYGAHTEQVLLTSAPTVEPRK